MKLYRITNWGELFETGESRKVKDPKWFPMPNRHDGLSFRRLALEPDGASLYGAWVMILQVASRRPRGTRGELSKNGVPLTAKDLSVITGFPTELFERALAYFSDPAQGWLIAEDPAESGGARERPCKSTADASGPHPGEPGSHPDNALVCQDAIRACQDLAPTEERRGEEKRGEDSPPPPASALPPEIPSLSEVIAFGSSRLGNQIPEDYCRHFFETTDNNREWLNGKGELRNWKGILTSWWEKDKHTWAAKRNRFGAGAEQIHLPRALQSNQVGGV